jgi:glycosyltransferase involved in cell wall biosynthesis
LPSTVNEVHRPIMRVLVALEQRYEWTPDGQVWGPGIFGTDFWGRYLRVFDEVKAFARIKKVAAASHGNTPIALPGLSFETLDDFQGAWSYARHLCSLHRAAARALNSTDAIIIRTPSLCGTSLYVNLRRHNRPYAVEVVGDAYDVLARGALNHPLRPILQSVLYLTQKWQCRDACGGAYVTKSALQKRYPLSENAFESHYSSVELGSEWFDAESDEQRFERRVPTIVTVATLAQMYKGVDVLIRAFATCVEDGMIANLRVIGDGQHREAMEALAERLGVSALVKFTGSVRSGEGVRRLLDDAHLFVLASRQEGLPRAMIEAMARGLPCIGTRVGGIPELLTDSDLVPPNDVPALALALKTCLANPRRLQSMSERNRAVAEHYASPLLTTRRDDFLRRLRVFTETWQLLRADSEAVNVTLMKA